jgi:DNA repair protein RecN (Recombination protein N)
LEAEKKTLLKTYYALSEEIHKIRVKTATKISQKVTTELQDLKMSGSEFKIEVQKLSTLTAKGQDQVVFMIAPNKGEGLKPLAKIASGGELSRIMLALTKVITEKLPLSLYIFDEIDAGIGGETGLVVGQKLQEISRQNQTICITHLPQVAVWAEGHFVISKGEINNRVTSKVEPLLNPQDLTAELARMLGGNMAKNESLSHAQAMIKLAHGTKKP